MNKRISTGLLVGAVAAAFFAASARSQTAPAGPAAPAPAVNTYKISLHSESLFAHELLRLVQPDLIKAEEARTKGTPAENLWKAQELVLNWDQTAKNRADALKATADYLKTVNAYLDATHDGLDGIWALDHVKFIVGKLSTSIVDRMEYWSNSPKDRAALAPMAALAERLLQQAKTTLDAGMQYAQAPGHPFDEALYMRDSDALAEAEYYNAWSQYFQAMAMNPGRPERKSMLLKAAGELGKWADDDTDNGVNNQALLLRGKIKSEAGDLPGAVIDLNKADNDNAPAWVRYQARYQIIVTRIRAGDFAAARAGLEKFETSLPKESLDAQMSTKMLGYRIAWAEAETKDGKARTDSENKALAILADIIQKDPRFRDLIYDQLASQIPDDADVKTLLPMQQLAIANSKAIGQDGTTPESRAQLQTAIKVALALQDNPMASGQEKLEGEYLAGACSAVLNQLQDAVKYSVDFVARAPHDPRSKPLLEVALQQINQLRAISIKAGTPLSKDMQGLVEQALALSTGTFDDPRFLYAQARTLEDDGKNNPKKLLDAAKIYARIQPDDKNYVDAQFRLVAIATTRFSQAQAEKVPASEITAVANDLFAACDDFVKRVLDNPPPNTPKDILDKAKTYRTDILIVEAATAVDPTVKKWDYALTVLGNLDAMKDQLTAQQKGAVLRYEIEALQGKGDVDKIVPKVSEYAKASGQKAIDVFQGLALSTVQEIQQCQETDPARAKRLAEFVVKLFDPIIDQKLKDSQDTSFDQTVRELAKKDAFNLKEIKADMMMRSGDYQGSINLCEKLLVEDNQDIRSNMTQARAYWVKAQATKSTEDYKIVKDYFGRIANRVTPGVDAYWECWLRIIQSTEFLAGSGGASDEIRKTLNNLKASTHQLGGDAFKDDFSRLATKYGVDLSSP